MSVQAISWAIKQPVKPAAAKLLLIVMANYADENGRLWPSKETLAKDCSTDKSSICKHLRLLSESGLIGVRQRRAGTANLSSVISLSMSDEVASTGSGKCPTGVVGRSRQNPSIEPPTVSKRPTRKVSLGDTVDGYDGSDEPEWVNGDEVLP